MKRITFICGLVLLIVAFASVPVGGATAPVGPRLATVELIKTKGPKQKDSAGSWILSASTLGASGALKRRLISGRLEGDGRTAPLPFYGPAWSTDGSQLAFTGTKDKKKGIYTASANGDGLRPIPGTQGGFAPIFSSDGHTLAFARSRSREDKDGFHSSTTTWLVDLKGGKPRRLTRWRDGLSNTPSSFTPDGLALLLTKSDDNLKGSVIMLTSLTGGGSRKLIEMATEPVLSPDGSQIAFAGYLHPDLVEADEEDYLSPDLYVAHVDGTGARRLTHTDDVIESSPSWDPSGQRIAYVQFRADTSFIPALGLLFPFGNALMQMNADGSCRTKIVSNRRVAFYGVAWQPGAGREAGGIPC
jgi:Tol biopolymer transport system component